jgi:hypothetical protein
MFAAGIVSCRQNPTCDAPSPMVDTAGSRSESDRSELQWLGMRSGVDSVPSGSQVLALGKSAHGSLERDVRRYGDSMRTSSGIVTSPGGCVDWRGSLVEGRLDRSALVTAMARTLVDTGANTVEWSLSDSAKDPARLRLIYAVAGPDGGRMDSATLLVGKTTVRK